MKLAFVALCMLVANQAKAALLIEPYVGYGMGKAEGILMTNISSYNDSYVTTATMFGGRVGIAIPLLFVAADYSMMTGTAKNGVLSYNISGTTIGAIAGVSIPFLRVWAGYNFSKTFKEITEAKGKGLRAGIGFTGLPFISINLEYMTTTYEKSSLQTAATGDANDSFALLSISLPMEF
ncbi:MAG: hypothetical protein V4692_14755 [Bdellovibrionota bacterium]